VGKGIQQSRRGRSLSKAGERKRLDRGCKQKRAAGNTQRERACLEGCCSAPSLAATARKARPMQGCMANGRVRARVPLIDRTSCWRCSRNNLEPAIRLASCSPCMPARSHPPKAPAALTPMPLPDCQTPRDSVAAYLQAPCDATVKQQLRQRQPLYHPVDSSYPIAGGAALRSLSSSTHSPKVAQSDPAARGA